MPFRPRRAREWAVAESAVVDRRRSRRSCSPIHRIRLNPTSSVRSRKVRSAVVTRIPSIVITSAAGRWLVRNTWPSVARPLWSAAVSRMTACAPRAPVGNRWRSAAASRARTASGRWMRAALRSDAMSSDNPASPIAPRPKDRSRPEAIRRSMAEPESPRSRNAERDETPLFSVRCRTSSRSISIGVRARVGVACSGAARLSACRSSADRAIACPHAEEYGQRWTANGEQPGRYSTPPTMPPSDRSFGPRSDNRVQHHTAQRCGLHAVALRGGG